jgi:beta-ribofuranosylaminobenzene 5'-phosphate synthase
MVTNDVEDAERMAANDAEKVATGGTVTVETGGRLHFGFGNLSLAHERLYGAVGVALAEPRLHVSVEPAAEVVCDHATARQYTERVCDTLGVPGARVTVHEQLPRHMGLGSGTQTALAVLAGVARAYAFEPRVRQRAPDLGRGGRSGIGVAAFESGGFVLDAGHPAERFTVERPADGEWTVPAVAARHDVPQDWRFLVVIPDAEPGRSGDGEDASMRSVVESADPAVADRIAGVLTRRLLPAVTAAELDRFGSAVAEIGRLNGSWYADEQGGVYRPPVGDLVAELRESPAVAGVGQSSWGPAVYAVTDAARADAAREAGLRALDAANADGDVRVVAGRNRGADVTVEE